MKAVEYTYLRFEQREVKDDKPTWVVKNIMWPDLVIGYIEWDVFINEYCYYPKDPHYEPQRIVLSQTNMCDICKFLNTLK
jgi:hypothetical protein